ncbi:MAG: hypothetical protein LWW85_14410 [Marinilabiliales bacterium]|nr:hypothetical protein [Marinilabiliales bacterium]
MKFRTLIILFIIPFITSAQREVKPEWIETDVSIFQHFFEIFPLKPEINEDDLLKRLDRFKNAECDSIGFGAVLHCWILPGGTITINSNIVTFQGSVIMAQTTIFKDYIHRLNGVFERDKTIKEKFDKYFKLQINTHYFNDSVYVYSYVNTSKTELFKNYVAKYLGDQKKVDLSQCEFEYNLLEEPTGRYHFDESYFRSTKDYPPVWASNKLVKEKRSDYILNIIRGYSLPGRMYGITAILQLVKEGEYSLTNQDKELIRKVLKMDLYVNGGYDLMTHTRYADCLNKELQTLIEK